MGPMKYETEIAQCPEEIDAFADLLRNEGVTSLLEIGSKFGGSLWKLGNALPEGSRIVSVDLPNGTNAWEESRQSLQHCAAALNDRGYVTEIVWGNSTAPDVILQVERYAPFDAIFIDADHRLPGVTADWHNYGPMGTIVAFHDIAWKRQPDWKGTRIDVPEFWDSIKDSYQHREFKFCPTGKNNGIGVLWRL
jgi:predicted O-methyltransferase YrrM